MPTGTSSGMDPHREGAWIEAIALFQSARHGDHASADRLLGSSSDPAAVVAGLLTLLGVYLRGEDPTKLDGFVAASHRVGPPPAWGVLPHPSARPAAPPTAVPAAPAAPSTPAAPTSRTAPESETPA